MKKLNNRILENYKGHSMVIKNEITDMLEEEMKIFSKNTGKFKEFEDDEDFFEHFFIKEMMEYGYHKELYYRLVVGNRVYGENRTGGLFQTNGKITSLGVFSGTSEEWLGGRYARYHSYVEDKLRAYLGYESDLEECKGRIF